MKNGKQLLSSFIIVFMVVILAANVLATLLIMDNLADLRGEINTIQQTVDVLEADVVREANFSEQKIQDFYREISNEADDAVNRLISIVAIVAGCATFFSLLLVFKAPHDIDKRIDRLDSLISDTRTSADEAKYQAEITSALAQKERYESIKKITTVIRRYPEKYDAYLMRGFLYDDIKKCDMAISDYEIARKLGCDKSVFYNSMAVAYSNKDDAKKAIEFYTKAIKIDNNNASYYCNRGCSYDDLGKYDQALRDYAKAIEIDDECYEAYYNRNFTYDKLWKKEKNEDKRKQYIKQRKEDLEKAVALNPDDDKARKELKKFIAELIDRGYLPSQREIIAEIDEKIGDINMKVNDCLEAYKYYADAFNYHVYARYEQGKEAHEEDLDRIAAKIVELVLNKKTSDVIEITAKKTPTLPERMVAIACKLYTEGEKFDAEVVFNVALPNKTAALNLAYMRRRNETSCTDLDAAELLAMSEDPQGAVWAMNKALCYIDGIEASNEWRKAVNIVNLVENEIDAAVEWWSNETLVGAKESNVAFLLLQLTHKYETEIGSVERIARAESDGYEIPDDIKPTPVVV